MHEAPPVLIAGGGIGGLALALALARLGHPSHVLERHEAPTTAGAGIQLGPNAVQALRWLGVADALEPSVGLPAAIEVRAGASGRHLAKLPLGPWVAARHGAPYWVAHRGDLHGALAAAASRDPRIAIDHATDVTEVTETAGRVSVRDTAGRTFTAPILIGADGLWSTVRQSVQPGSVPRPAGATAMRTVIPAEAGGGLRTGAVGVWLSPVAHVVHYPVRAGREVAVVVIARSDSTPQDRATPRSIWDAEASLPRLQATLAPFHALLRNVLLPDLATANSMARVERASANGAPGVPRWPWREWTLHTLPPLRTWRRGRMALIGDAAHPMLPYLAQGGALALEDAVVMGHCLHATDDPAAALARFESLRTQRAARVQSASRRQGGIYHLPPPLSWARDAVLGAAPGTRLMAGYDWLYGWRLP